MRRFFGHIISQPKAVRNNYAMAFASTFTGLVALVWIVTKVGSGVTLPLAAAENAPGAFSTLFKETKEQAATVQEAFKDKLAAGSATTTTEAAAPNLGQLMASSSSSEATLDATTTSTMATTSLPRAIPVLIGTTTATSATSTATTTP